MIEFSDRNTNLNKRVGDSSVCEEKMEQEGNSNVNNQGGEGSVLNVESEKGKTGRNLDIVDEKNIESIRAVADCVESEMEVRSAELVDKGIDEESERGRFGWAQIDSKNIPYLIRSNEKYVSIRMVDKTLSLKFFKSIACLDKKIYEGAPVDSFYVTEAELRLLNEINLNHCDAHYGLRLFSAEERIVKLSDVEQFSKYITLCYDKLASNQSTDNVCGFIMIDGDYVPYSTLNGEKVVPFFYFEGETESLEVKTFNIDKWPLFYLKFCLHIQRIKSTFFDHDSLEVACFEDIKNHFPPGTTFEYKWPPHTEKHISSLLKNDNAENISFADLIRKPLDSPIVMTPEAAMRIYSANGMDNYLDQTNCPLSTLLMNRAVTLTKQPPTQRRRQHLIAPVPQNATTPLQSDSSNAHSSQINSSQTNNPRENVRNFSGVWDDVVSFLTARCSNDTVIPSESDSLQSLQRKGNCNADNRFFPPRRYNDTSHIKTSQRKLTSQKRYCDSPSPTCIPPEFAALVQS